MKRSSGRHLKHGADEKDPGALTYKILDQDFPLCSNSLSLVIGGTGSGKSYFTYNYLLPAYIEHFEVKWVIICSKTASCDTTLQRALAKCGAGVIIDSNISSLFQTAQKIRAQAIKTEYIRFLAKHKDPEETGIAELKQKIVKMKTYPALQEELRDLMKILENICDPDNYTVIPKFSNKEQAFMEGERFKHTYIKPDREELEKGRREVYKNKIDPETDKKYPMAEPTKDDLSESNPEDTESTDNDDACIQLLTLENTVVNKIAEDNKYDDDDSDPEKTTIELSYAIIVKSHSGHKIGKERTKQLINKRIKANLQNLLIAGEEVYGPEYQPILLVVDDNAVSSELSNPNSAFTQLCLTRRHLHCNIVILVQGVTYINTSIRRNATSMHLLPTMSGEDLKLIEKRLPKGLINDELASRYLSNTQHGTRDQQMTHIFMASNPSSIVDGLPDCISQFKLK